jgi:hypothetical protein
VRLDYGGLPASQRRAIFSSLGTGGTIEAIGSTVIEMHRLIAGTWEDNPVEGTDMNRKHEDQVYISISLYLHLCFWSITSSP